jgi:hypothetical protein
MQLGTPGGQEEQFHVGGYREPLDPVPTRSVQHQEKELVCMTLGELGEKHAHGFGMDPRS